MKGLTSRTVARRFLSRSVKIIAASSDGLHHRQPGLVILIYHRVGGGSGSEVDLPIALFDEQMEHLAAGGRVVSLSAGLAAVGGSAPRGEPPLVVTFDDGTADFADNAVPILVRHGVAATLYAATAFIDEGRAFPSGARPLSWSALADACATGHVEVGSHTHTHRLLDRLPATEVGNDLDRSIELIGEHLGHAPVDFAYPKALLGPSETEAAVRARFRSAALAGTRANPFGASDPYRLARSPIQTADGMRWFVRKAAGGMAVEDGLRRVLNRHRYASANT